MLFLTSSGGYNTIKINHLGDWGKYLVSYGQEKWKQEAVEANPIDELLQLYVRITAESKTTLPWMTKDVCI